MNLYHDISQLLVLLTIQLIMIGQSILIGYTVIGHNGKWV